MESTAVERVPLSTYVRVVRTNANFRNIWFAQIISEIGDWLYIIAIYSHLLELTGGKAKSVGFAFVLQVLPQMLTAPIAGVLNDRLSRRTIMIYSDWCRAIIITLMLFAQTPDMIWFIYVLLFLETVCWGLFEPARTAVIPNITEGEETLAANSLATTTWSFNFAVGSAIGGLIAAFAGKQAAFLLNGLTFIISALLVSRTRFTEPHVAHHPPLRWRDLNDFSMIRDGLSYVSKDKRLFATMLAKCGLGFMGANWVLLTIFGERRFPLHIAGADAKAAGMIGMSLLMGCRGIGAIIGPVTGTYIAGSNQRRMRSGIALGFLFSGLGYILLGQSPNLISACLSIMFAHCGGSIIWVFSTNLLQMNAEDKFRGRVFSAEFGFMTLSMSISSALAGMYLDSGVEPERVASAAGLVMLIPGLLWLWALRLWRKPNGV